MASGNLGSLPVRCNCVDCEHWRICDVTTLSEGFMPEIEPVYNKIRQQVDIFCRSYKKLPEQSRPLEKKWSIAAYEQAKREGTLSHD